MAAGIQEIFTLEYEGFTVEVTVSETYDILANTSDVSVGMRMKSAYEAVGLYLSGSIKLDGKILVDMDSTIATHVVRIFSTNTWYNVEKSSNNYTDSPWTQEGIAHNTDGSKSITLNLEVRGYGGDGWLRVRVATSRTIKLTHIPRASTVGASDANIGAVSTLSVVRRSTAYTHTIAFQFGALSGYILEDGSISATAVKLTATSIPFLLPTSFYPQIPNSPTGVCTLTIRTYSGNAQIGEAQTAKFTVTAPRSQCSPNVSGAVEDTNAATLALTGNKNTLVRYMSNALCTITAEAKNSATIISKLINGVEITGDSLTLTAIETDTITFNCIDSRGYSSSVSIKKSMIPYINLTANVSATRTDPTSGNATLSASGNAYNGSFGAVSNEISVSYIVNSGAAVMLPPTMDGNTYASEADLSGLDYQRSHRISVTVTDKLQSITKTVNVGKGIPVFDWGEEDFQFHVPVYINGVNILEKLQELLS